MKKLIKGIVDFRKKSIEEYRQRFAKLSLQQKPDALMVACCDSRVVPNVFASSDSGDLFVLRNIFRDIKEGVSCKSKLCKIFYKLTRKRLPKYASFFARKKFLW